MTSKRTPIRGNTETGRDGVRNPGRFASNKTRIGEATGRLEALESFRKEEGRMTDQFEYTDYGYSIEGLDAFTDYAEELQETANSLKAELVAAGVTDKQLHQYHSDHQKFRSAKPVHQILAEKHGVLVDDPDETFEGAGVIDGEVVAWGNVGYGSNYDKIVIAAT